MNPEVDRSVAWFREISEAAAEIGYGVVEISLGRVQLVRLADKRPTTVTIESVFLHGGLLRAVLVAVPTDERSAP